LRADCAGTENHGHRTLFPRKRDGERTKPGRPKESFMGTLSIWHILILAVVALLLFGGRGKISDLMGDVAKGIKAFRSGLNDTEHGPLQSRAIAPEQE
jgi:sec-independent protein translocase protein TatA